MQLATKYLDENESRLLNLAEQDPHDALVLSQKEEQILRLHDKLKELELERAILAARATHGANQSPEPDVAQQVSAAERELLETRGRHTVKRKMVDGVVTADPILRAVHGGDDLLPTERALLPLINRRDVLSMVHENLFNSLTSIQEAQTTAEVANIRALKRNQRLAAELLELTSRLSAQKEEITDTALRGRFQEIEAETKRQRAQWRMLKSMTSAMVVASGVDWARDDKLCSLVMDDEENDT